MEIIMETMIVIILSYYMLSPVPLKLSHVFFEKKSVEKEAGAFALVFQLFILK